MSDTLREILIDDATTQQRFLKDCVVLIDDEVAEKKGISGLAIKGCL